MDIAQNIPDEVKRELNTAISESIAYRREVYGRNDTAFTRTSELTKERMMKLLLSMNGGSLEKELYKAGIRAGKSAFSQRRNQICNLDFEDILERFNTDS